MDSDQGGEVSPKQDCPHLFDSLKISHHDIEVWETKCKTCGNEEESWMCTTCKGFFCSRYVAAHMASHSVSESHFICISLSDLSVWCYSCEQYIKHDALFPLLVKLEVLKFGSSVNSNVLQLLPKQFTTGFFYDERMTLHAPTAKKCYENPFRVEEVYRYLQHTGTIAKCRPIPPRMISVEELALVHTEEHIQRVLGTETSEAMRNLFQTDTYANENTALAAKIACGGCVDISMQVAQDHLQNGFSLVRPPGHHCTASQHQGFCIFNNVAVSAAVLLKHFHNNYKIWIVDWDVHHGNGVQEIFYSNPQVLYTSLHRYEHAPGLFYSHDGKVDRIGEGSGQGKNVNVPFPFVEGGFGDEDYFKVFDEIFVPIGKEFQPDIILVCCGFDALKGDPMGEFQVSPEAFGVLTHKLQAVQPSVVLCLEGGYAPSLVAKATQHCLDALLHTTTQQQNPNPRQPKPEVIKLIQQVKEIQSPFWKALN